ncbi:MAG: P1 family peptidase [Alphaproteobacteria bacterium]|nr:P1 family peptidase [Alphaproteobacteria bacterium]
MQLRPTSAAKPSSAPPRRNLISDVEGLTVGNADDARLRSGVTVVLCAEPFVAAVDVRGGAPGTRETDLLAPTSLVQHVDAIVLSGGSAFGLESAAGVSAWLAARQRGYAVGPVRVPIVPAAILFDLLNGGDKEWGAEPPYRALGMRACEQARADFALGNAGAGLGAIAGEVKGGLGSASVALDGGIVVAALIAANAVGSPVIPGTRTLWAWAAEQGGEFGNQGPPSAMPDWSKPYGKQGPKPGANTTVGVVATNATLTPAQAQRVALMAQDGIARAVRPAHSPFDGDTLFAVATGRNPRLIEPAELAAIGDAAAACVERSIGRAVYLAEALGDIPAFRTR